MKKVSVFVIYENQLLVFNHPLAGVQLPAGTVEPGESMLEAAAREVWEETGVSVGDSRGVVLGCDEAPTPDGWAVMSKTTAGPQPLQRGHSVKIMQRLDDRYVVEERVFDYSTSPPSIIERIEGFVPTSHLAFQITRGFVCFNLRDRCPENEWLHRADGHVFHVFWADPNTVELVDGQQTWLTAYRDELRGFINRE